VAEVAVAGPAGGIVNPEAEARRCRSLAAATAAHSAAAAARAEEYAWLRGGGTSPEDAAATVGVTSRLSRVKYEAAYQAGLAGEACA
jgi:hypothetical protein